MKVLHLIGFSNKLVFTPTLSAQLSMSTTCKCSAKKGQRDLRALLKVPVIWVLGGPGSGKGTQCEKIIQKYGFTHLSSGDLLRDEVESKSERGKSLQATMSKGELVQMKIVLDLIREAMIKAAPKATGFLIDGYPREKEQGLAFEAQITPVNLILFFECDEDTLVERLMGRALSSERVDDNEETIKKRIQVFNENNEEVLALYPEKLRRINAERSVDEIFAEVESYLDNLIANFQVKSYRK